MTVKDMIKRSVYDTFANGISYSNENIVFLLCTTLFMGVYIFFIYKFITKKEYYSMEFNITLVGMSIITAAIIVAIQSNLIVSMGMVGALSIVRFRTAIKNPLDLLFLFWSISVGIIGGVGLIYLNAIMCLIITLVLFILKRLSVGRSNALMVIRTNLEAEKLLIEDIIKKNSYYYRENSIIVNNGEKEYMYNIKSQDIEKLISELYGMNGIVCINYIMNE